MKTETTKERPQGVDLKRLVVPPMVQVAGALIAFGIWDFDPAAMGFVRFLCGWVILTCGIDWSWSLRSRHNI